VLNKLAWVSGDSVVLVDHNYGFAESGSECSFGYVPFYELCTNNALYNSRLTWDHVTNQISTAFGFYEETRNNRRYVYVNDDAHWYVTYDNTETEARKEIAYGVTCFATGKTATAEYYVNAAELNTNCFLAIPTNALRRGYYVYQSAATTASDISDISTVSGDWIDWESFGLRSSLVLKSPTQIDVDGVLYTLTWGNECLACDSDTSDISILDFCYGDHPEWFPESASSSMGWFGLDGRVTAPTYTKISLIKYTPEFHE
jgi:hypothetical protein